jgi:hypothetical protein
MVNKAIHYKPLSVWDIVFGFICYDAGCHTEHMILTPV